MRLLFNHAKISNSASPIDAVTILVDSNNPTTVDQLSTYFYELVCEHFVISSGSIIILKYKNTYVCMYINIHIVMLHYLAVALHLILYFRKMIHLPICWAFSLWAAGNCSSDAVMLSLRCYCLYIFNFYRPYSTQWHCSCGVFFDFYNYNSSVEMWWKSLNLLSVGDRVHAYLTYNFVFIYM